jgi:hypothetical protein
MFVPGLGNVVVALAMSFPDPMSSQVSTWFVTLVADGVKVIASLPPYWVVGSIADRKRGAEQPATSREMR